MLTLVTGTPGAGKTLHTVWEICRAVPGTTIEVKGEAVPRRLFSNIKGLLLDHTHIDVDDLNKWHTWAKPGDVIVFDEVQEAWRPRGMNVKVPDCIAKLETHRHMGVDLVLITQHPNLLDQNIRRLVNQHLHLRRVTRRTAWLYEWDHCSEVKSTAKAIQSTWWRHPVKGYALYKSAEAHTKPTARLPRLAFVGLVAAAGLVYAVPNALDRVSGALGGRAAEKVAEKASGAVPGPRVPASGVRVLPGPVPGFPARPSSAPVVAAAPAFAGCVRSGDACRCLDTRGQLVPVEPAQCLSVSGFGRGAAVDLGGDTVRPVDLAQSLGDADVLAWMAKRSSKPR